MEICFINFNSLEASGNKENKESEEINTNLVISDIGNILSTNNGFIKNNGEIENEDVRFYH
jgi:hypothetical protein